MKFEFGCDVYDLDADVIKGKVTAKRVLLKQDGKQKEIFLGEDDLVFIQNGSMTDASALGSWKQPAPYNTLAEATSFRLWEKFSRFENTLRSSGQCMKPRPLIHETMKNNFLDIKAN